MSSCELEPGPVPCESDNRDAASYVSALPARAGRDSEHIVPSVGHCHSGSARLGKPGQGTEALGRHQEEGEAGPGSWRGGTRSPQLTGRTCGLVTALPAAGTGARGRGPGRPCGRQRFSFLAKLRVWNRLWLLASEPVRGQESWTRLQRSPLRARKAPRQDPHEGAMSDSLPVTGSLLQS